jgi:hypothetical protein
VAPRPVALADAVEVLGTLLERYDGKVPSDVLEAEREAAGVSPRTMTRARAVLGTVAVRDGRGWCVIRPYPTREVL